MQAATPQNILVVHNNNDLYGGDKVLLELLSRLDRTRFVPFVVLPTDTRHINRFSPHLDKLGIEYRFVPLGILRRRYFKLWRLPRFAFEVLTGARALPENNKKKKDRAGPHKSNPHSCRRDGARMKRLPHIWSIHELVLEP